MFPFVHIFEFMTNSPIPTLTNAHSLISTPRLTLTFTHTFHLVLTHPHSFKYCHTHNHTHLYSHIHPQTYIYTHTYTHSCIHSHSHTHIDTNSHMLIHTYIHAYSWVYSVHIYSLISIPIIPKFVFLVLIPESHIYMFC